MASSLTPSSLGLENSHTRSGGRKASPRDGAGQWGLGGKLGVGSESWRSLDVLLASLERGRPS